MHQNGDIYTHKPKRRGGGVYKMNWEIIIKELSCPMTNSEL